MNVEGAMNKDLRKFNWEAFDSLRPALVGVNQR